MPYLRPHPNGFVLDLAIIPRASQTQVMGLHDGALRLRLAAPPVEGQANKVLLQWLSKTLKIPQARCQLLRGDTSRRKQVLIVGDGLIDAAYLRACLVGSPENRSN